MEAGCKIPVTCLDFEGVLIPEIWVGLATKTGIDELKLTTRDIEDYDELMQHRLRILDQHGLTLKDVHQVVDTMEPMVGAKEFLTWLRARSEVIILSDTFREFVAPLVRKLDFPTLFCHSLEVDENKRIVNYCLRQPDQKSKAVNALHSLNFRTIAAGDSYNDLGMLHAANIAAFFKPTEKITQEYPQFPVTQDYDQLRTFLVDQARLPAEV